MSQPYDVDSGPLAALCAQYGIASLAVFGSLSRGDASKTSDVDLLYELLPGRRLGWEIEELSQSLAGLFGRPVDLVARTALHPMLRKPIEADAMGLYAA
jgi:predicted nucleotidyltransferase